MFYPKKFMKEASLILPGDLGAFIGVSRSSNMSDKERDALRKYYGLSSVANLTFRNAGRGVAGDLMGTLSCATIGSVFGLPASVGLGLAGGILGTHLMTHKYTPEEARRILRKIQEKEE